MPIHAVMVRLEFGSDYSERYEKTVDAIHQLGGGAGPVWEEPTSTYILSSELNAESLCNAIYYGAPIYEARDTLVVVNLSYKGPGCYAAKGVKYPNTLRSLMAAR